MKKSLYAREATHAGTWYDSDPKKLGADLDGYIDSAKVEKNSAKVVVTPHAGYIYCGPTSGHSFRALDKGEGVNKVFVIGPSHFVDFKGCAVTMYDAVVTPFGEIPVDKALRNELLATHKFALMGELGDLNEHSLEMEYPILKRAFGEKPFTVVPVFVSLADMKAIEMYGRIFAKYLADPSCVFVVSSDFCHWGKRYEYTYINKEWMGEGTISDSIRELDHLGARLIVDRDPKKFLDYIDEYKSPVCGNIAIAIMLAAMNASGDPYKGEFVHYSQSDVVRTMDDFAVGYCSITFGKK